VSAILSTSQTSITESLYRWPIIETMSSQSLDAYNSSKLESPLAVAHGPHSPIKVENSARVSGQEESFRRSFLHIPGAYVLWELSLLTPEDEGAAALESVLREVSSKKSAPWADRNAFAIVNAVITFTLALQYAFLYWSAQAAGFSLAGYDVIERSARRLLSSCVQLFRCPSGADTLRQMLQAQVVGRTLHRRLPVCIVLAVFLNVWFNQILDLRSVSSK
jgi:hypothetical protein